MAVAVKFRSVDIYMGKNGMQLFVNPLLPRMGLPEPIKFLYFFVGIWIFFLKSALQIFLSALLCRYMYVCVCVCVRVCVYF